jgi:hypothetical protein
MQKLNRSVHALPMSGYHGLQASRLPSGSEISTFGRAANLCILHTVHVLYINRHER